MPPRHRLAGALTAQVTPLAIAFAAALLLTLAPHLATAELWQYDEWYTAERTQGVLSGNWLTLHGNGLPVFKKPPLQYWLSALLQLGGVPELLSLRLPSYAAGFGLVALTAGLARRLSGGHALAAPVTLLLLLSSTRFWLSSASALLDTGAALCLTGALLALLAAWDRPRFWWIAALCLGAGALQKAPVAAALLPLLALGLWRWQGPPRRAGVHLAALLPAVALPAFWPLTQGWLHGAASLERSYLREQVFRFLPGQGDWSRHLRWTDWIAADGALLWTGMIAATLALPFLKARSEPRPPQDRPPQDRPPQDWHPQDWHPNTIPAQARIVALLVAGFFAALSLARGEIFDRYLMQILPVTAAAAGACLVRIKPPHGLMAAAILSIASGGPWKSPDEAGLTQQGITPYRPLLAAFHAALRPQEQPVVCGWGRSDLIIPPGALWLLGSAGKPFRRVWSPAELSAEPAADPATTPAADLRKRTLTPPLRGLCLTGEYADLSAILPTRTVATRAGWVHWTLP